jgi:hypothetical protein
VIFEFIIADPGRIVRRLTPFGKKVLFSGRVKMKGAWKIKNAGRQDFEP